MDVKKVIIAVLAVGIVVLAALLFLLKPQEVIQEPASIEPVVEEVIEAPQTTQSTIGVSVEGRSIEAYTFGNGEETLLFVGGIHGGYEWNSVLLAYEFIDRFTANPELVPEGVAVHIIPNLNPDAVYKVTGVTGRFTQDDIIPTVDQATARFNANGVDLNRNFDCKWQPESSWRGQTVSAGSFAFSEPEAVALRNYVLQTQPTMVAFWHSQANNVYASECEAGVLPETLLVMNTYANAAGYGAVASFDAYPVTGDAEGWLASIGIPAVTVELSSHESLDLVQNIAGVEALLVHYGTQASLAR